jgi:putative phosphoribosyl transferase
MIAMPFKDRSDAGRKLAKALAGYKNRQPVVLALPRGGVPVAAEVCAALKAPLDLILVRKIGVPFQPELAMGAVVDGSTPIIVRNEDVIQVANIDETTFIEICDAELSKIERRRQQYWGTRDRVEVAGHTAIVIDDGIATGATMRAALHAIRARKPQKLVLAVLVAPTSTLVELQREADEIISLEEYEVFGAIGIYYANFRQVSDQEVIDILKRFAIAATKPKSSWQCERSRTLDTGQSPSGLLDQSTCVSSCPGGCHERSGSRKHRTYRSPHTYLDQ